MKSGLKRPPGSSTTARAPRHATSLLRPTTKVSNVHRGAGDGLLSTGSASARRGGRRGGAPASSARFTTNLSRVPGPATPSIACVSASRWCSRIHSRLKALGTSMVNSPASKQVARSGAIQVSKSFANRQARSCRRTSPQTASSIHRPLVVPIPDRFLRDAPLGFVHTWGEVAEPPAKQAVHNCGRLRHPFATPPLPSRERPHPTLHLRHVQESNMSREGLRLPRFIEYCKVGNRRGRVATP